MEQAQTCKLLECNLHSEQKLLALVWKVLIMILTTEHLLVKKKFYTESQGLFLIKTGSTSLSKIFKYAQHIAECLVRRYPFNVDNVNVVGCAFR